MTKLSFDEAHAVLMSASPPAQYSGSVGLRNFAAAAQGTAVLLRDGSGGAGGGDAGAAAAQQAQVHAAWFEQVAGTASATADKVDALVARGTEHQVTAASVMAGYQQAVAADSGPAGGGRNDMDVIHHLNSGTVRLNSAVDDWSSAYSGFVPAQPPPPPAPAGGVSGGSGSGYHPGSGPAAVGGAGSAGGSGPIPPLLALGAGGAGAAGAARAAGGGGGAGGRLVLPDPGSPGSVQVGPGGGEFAGWFIDPRTGFYIDPSSGREFDPATSRWIDPVTGQPFGAVTRYATQLQGLGGASTSGGLLADTGATLGGTAGGFGGGGGGFAALFSGAGNTLGVAGGYGGVLPPSLASGSAGVGRLWGQAGQSLALKQQVAAELLAREQAARAGRPYLPPTQAGMGGAPGGAGSRRGRPDYLIADEAERALFNTTAPRAAGESGATAAEAEAQAGTRTATAARTTAAGEAEPQAAGAGRRAYLPPTQAAAGTETDKAGKKRPDWLTDADVFNAGIEASPAVLGD